MNNQQLQQLQQLIGDAQLLQQKGIDFINKKQLHQASLMFNLVAKKSYEISELLK